MCVAPKDCDFIVQLVEHRTGNAEVMGLNPVKALNFFLLLLNYKNNCGDNDFFTFPFRSSYTIYSYTLIVSYSICRNGRN